MSSNESETTALTDESMIETTSENPSTVLFTETNETAIENSEEYANILSYIDEKIKVVISGDDYKKGDLDARVQLLQPVPEQLLDEECIVDYQFNLEGDSPNVYLKYSGGGGGAVLLQNS